MKQQNKN